LADTLADIQAMLPLGLARSERMLSDPPEVVEIWFADGANASACFKASPQSEPATPVAG
jgi:hypothetical protein